jgi:hypothetical protein
VGARQWGAGEAREWGGGDVQVCAGAPLQARARRAQPAPLPRSAPASRRASTPAGTVHFSVAVPGQSAALAATNAAQVSGAARPGRGCASASSSTPSTANRVEQPRRAAKLVPISSPAAAVIAQRERTAACRPAKAAVRQQQLSAPKKS